MPVNHRFTHPLVHVITLLASLFFITQLSPVATAAELVTADKLSTPALRLQYMRKHLHPYWVPIEAGGIFLLAGMDEKANAAAFTPLLGAPGQVGAAAVQQNKAEEQLLDELNGFFEKAMLKPGNYELDNYHLSYAHAGKLAFDSNGNPPIPLPTGKHFKFALTDTHLKLIRHMNTRSWQGIIEIMDPKRPYGDFTYYFAEMAEALGEPVPRNAKNEAELSAEQEAKYLKLHHEMLFAVQAFWTYAQ